jgi:hypothetical protein
MFARHPVTAVLHALGRLLATLGFDEKNNDLTIAAASK